MNNNIHGLMGQIYVFRTMIGASQCIVLAGLHGTDPRIKSGIQQTGFIKTAGGLLAGLAMSD